MNVLMLSLDPALLEDHARASDTQQRHTAYAEELNRQRPSSALYIIVRASHGQNVKSRQLAPNLWVYPVSGERIFFPWEAYWTGEKLHKQAPFDLVTTQSPFLDGLIGYALKRRHGIPLLLQLHLSSLKDPAWQRERWSNFLRRELARWLMQRADGIKVYTPEVKNWLTSEWRIPPSQIYVNPITIPLSIKKQWGLPLQAPSKPPQVLYVGRLSPEKGVDLLLRAFIIVALRSPETRLVIVGDGPQRPALQAMAKANVIFTGPVPPQELGKYYQTASLLVLPSHHESYGRVILEAYSFGRPVVATDTEGARALIRDGETGFIVPRDDPDALAEKILYLLHHPEIAMKMGIEGRTLVQEQHDPETRLRQLIEIWIKVAEGAENACPYGYSSCGP
ncbi:MAG: glycosyltransferase family 4 protein [Anaerolineae bacterium]